MDHYTILTPEPAAPPPPSHGAGSTDSWSRRHAPATRVAFKTAEGRLALAAEGEASPVPLENIEPHVLGQAVRREEPILRPALDSQGRTVILVYAPAGEDRAPAIFLVSLTLLGEAVRQIARDRFGMTRLSARLCAALVETGALPRAARASGVTYMTAQSEMSDIMQATYAHTQSATVCRLADTWLTEPLEAGRAAGLLQRDFGLNQREAQIAALIAAGRTRAQAGTRLNLSRWAVKSACTRIYAAVGVNKAPELTRVAIDLMMSDRLAQSLARNIR